MSYRQSSTNNDSMISTIADYWVMLVIRELMLNDGERRFDQLVAKTQVSRNILSGRLKALMSEGLIDKAPVCKGARRMTYRLTAQGWDLLPVMIAIQKWGDRWSNVDIETKKAMTYCHYQDDAADLKDDIDNEESIEEKSSDAPSLVATPVNDVENSEDALPQLVALESKRSTDKVSAQMGRLPKMPRFIPASTGA